MSDETTSTPAEMYEQFFGPAIFTPLARVLLGHADPRPGERVLDVACGTGILARAVAPLVGAEGRVVGIDISPDMLAVARSRAASEGAEIEWREGDAEALDLPDDDVDLVLCQQGLQFVPDRAAATHEMRRVIDDGGRAVVAVWEAVERHPVYEAIFDAEARYLGLELSDLAVPFSLADADELQALFVDAGFDRVQVESAAVDVRFGDAERLVQLTTVASSAVIPQLGDGGPEQKAALAEFVDREVQPTLERYRDGDGVAFPMHANVAVARA